ncbi:MAG: hypothetical protein HOI23_08635 [Deltaproteobacteria bacterium]|nr:hypothetical protein [Deltaproteobacteria bacterium]
MPSFPTDGRPPVLPGLPTGALEPDDSAPVERPSARGDAMMHPASSTPLPAGLLRPMESQPMDDGSLTRELPILELPDGETTGVSTRPALRTNPAPRRGPAPSTTTVSEHSSDGNTDRARFDNGSERYDWDVTTDGVGDMRGRAGAGVTRGETSAYLDAEFDENTGAVDARLSADHRLNDSTSVRGSVGTDGNDINHAGAGATRTFEGGHRTDVDVNWDRDNGVSGEAGWSHAGERGHENVTVRGNEDGGDVHYSGSHRAGGLTSRETLTVDSEGNVDGRVDVEGRHEIRPGTSVSGSGHVTTDGSFAGDARVDHRINEDVTAHSSVRVDSSGRRSHEHGVRTDIGDGRGSLSGDVRHSTDGSRSVGADGSLRTDHGRHSGSARVSDSDNGPASLDARYGFDSPTTGGSSRTSVDVDGRVDENGNWRAHGRVEHRVTDGVTVTEDLRVDSNGRRVHGHEVRADLGENRGTVGAEVTHSNDGSLSAEARYDWSEGENAVGARAGTTDGEHHVSGNYTHTSETGSESVSGGYRTGEGLHGEGRIVREIGDDSEVEATLRGNSRGDVSGTLRGTTRVGENNDINLSGRINASTTDNRVSADVNVGRSATREAPGFGMRAGGARDDHSVSGNLGGDLSVTNLLGSALKATLGADAGVELTKRYEAQPGFGWRGDVREAALDANPGHDFVSFAGRGRASVNIGGNVPVGVGYVNAGYKRGEVYDVEVTRLTDDPRLGTIPTLNDLTVPQDAKGVLGMRAGESFKITGTSTHVSNAGGGVGTSVGAEGIGSVKLSAGVDISYTVSGRNSIDVTRGDGESARIVVSAEDKMTVGGDLKAVAGATPDYAALGSAIGTDRLPTLGPVSDIAGGVAKGVAKRWLSAEGRAGGRKTEGSNRILDARLDLSDDVAKAAYDKAMLGDWTELESLNRAGHPGVDIDRSIFTELDERATPLTVSGLGLAYKGESKETLRESDVVVDEGTYKVSSDVDANSRVMDSWANKSSFSVTDSDRSVTGVDGAELGDVKATENWLTWAHSYTENVASKDDVLAKLRLANFVSSGDEKNTLNAYTDKLEAVEEHRKLWVGPRNELRNTTVTTKVSLGDKALDNVTNLTDAKVWEMYEQQWLLMHPENPTPPWADEEMMPLFMDPTVMLAKSVVRMMEKKKATGVVKRLVQASKTTNEEKRNDLIREVLAEQHGDPVVLAMLVEMVGRDNVKLEVQVDSNAGDAGTEYDFSLSDTGSGFDVQTRVFGENL